MPGIINQWKRTLKGQRGTAIVEFGLMVILFLMLVVGLMEFGRAMLDYSVVSSAAREGVRYAAVRGSKSGHAATATDISNYVKSKALGLPVDVNVSWEPDNAPGNKVRVQVDYTFTSVAPVLLSTNTIRLRSSSKMVIAQ